MWCQVCGQQRGANVSVAKEGEEVPRNVVVGGEVPEVMGDAGASDSSDSQKVNAFKLLMNKWTDSPGYRALRSKGSAKKTLKQCRPPSIKKSTNQGGGVHWLGTLWPERTWIRLAD